MSYNTRLTTAVLHGPRLEQQVIELAGPEDPRLALARLQTRHPTADEAERLVDALIDGSRRRPERGGRA